ncbi:MAG: PD-(D/E)XK nuclease family protein, partial [Rudaea sp.]
LPHYAPIRHQPGLTRALVDLFAEFKRALITPERLAAAIVDRGARLTEIAELYAAYQARLKAIDWADGEGLGWLALDALDDDPVLASGWRLLLVDGFDSFNAVTLKVLARLSGRVDEFIITLTGDREMTRPVYRRFAQTLEDLTRELHPEIESLEPHDRGCPPLTHLARSLMEPAAAKIDRNDCVHWLEAQNQRLEAREALRWIKARIVRDGVPAEACAVIARDLQIYRPYLREAAREFGLPIRFLGSEPLSSNPAIAAVVTLLELPLLNWPRRPLLDCIRTAYFDLTALSLSHEDAALLDQVAHQSQVIEGVEQWQEALAALAARTAKDAIDEDEDESSAVKLPRGDEAARLAKGLDAFFKRMTPPAEGTLAGYATWIQDLLFGANGLRILDQVNKPASGEATVMGGTTDDEIAERDSAALAAFGEALHAIPLAEAIAGVQQSISYREFESELRGIVDSSGYTAGTGRVLYESRVYAGNLNTTRGISYDAVAMLGLSEGILPAPVLEDPFLSDEDRAALRKQGLPIELRRRGDQLTLLYEAVTRPANHLLLTRPYLADDGEKWAESPYWRATLSLFDDKPERVRPDKSRPLEQAASPLELLTSARRAGVLPAGYSEFESRWQFVNGLSEVLKARQGAVGKSKYDGECVEIGGLIAEAYSDERTWSATALEKFGSCPFHFWLSSAMELEVREPPEAGYDAAQLGSMLHEILQKVYPASGNPQDVDAVLAVLPAVAQDVFDTAPEEYGFRPTALWETQRRELEQALFETLQALADISDGFVPFAFESTFGYDGSPLELDIGKAKIKLRGRIDRVDRNPDGQLRVIDYKTSATAYSKKELIEGRRLQIALYALGAEKQLPGSTVVDGLYWDILHAKPASLRLCDFEHRDKNGREYARAKGAIQLAVGHIGAYVTRIRSANFPPGSTSETCPSYCPGRIACWHYNPSEH